MLKPILIAVGSLSLALGVLGIVLPMLPTTPFLLLAAWAFARSSQRLHSRLVNHRILGEYISNYYDNTMTRAHKLRTVALLWLSIILTVAFLAWSGRHIPAIVLPFIAAAVTVHILTLRPKATRNPHEPQLDESSPAPVPDTSPDHPSAGTTGHDAEGTR